MTRQYAEKRVPLVILTPLFPGVFREPRLPRGRPQDLPHPGDSRDRPLRAVEDGSLQVLPARRPHRPGGQDSGTGPAMDPGLPGTERHSHAARQVSFKYPDRTFESFRVSTFVDRRF